VPLLGGVAAHTGGPAWLKVAKLVGVLAALVIGGRFLVNPVLRYIARTGLREIFTGFALLLVIAICLLMQSVGLSMALGTFVAGVLLADSEYRHELMSDIEPFKGLLLGLFFISVGMGANIGLLFQAPAQVLGLTLLLVLIKLPLLIFIGRLGGGLDRRSALRLGLVLAAGGEFAFVVFKIGREQGLFDAGLYDLLVLTITLSMALTPLLLLAGRRLLKARPLPAREIPAEYSEIESDAPRVVIAGMGRMGQIIARILRAQKINFVALDTAVESIEFSRSFGHVPVFYGDPLRPEILQAAKVEQAEYFVIATDDPDINIRTAELVSRLYPHIKIIARARNRQHVHRLVDFGAVAVRETYYSSLEMSRRTLMGLGLSQSQADARIRRFKMHDEQVLQEQHKVYDDAAKVMQSAQEARAELSRLFDADRAQEEAEKAR